MSRACGDPSAVHFGLMGFPQAVRTRARCHFYRAIMKYAEVWNFRLAKRHRAGSRPRRSVAAAQTRTGPMPPHQRTVRELISFFVVWVGQRAVLAGGLRTGLRGVAERTIRVRSRPGCRGPLHQPGQFPGRRWLLDSTGSVGVDRTPPERRGTRWPATRIPLAGANLRSHRSVLDCQSVAGQMSDRRIGLGWPP